MLTFLKLVIMDQILAVVEFIDEINPKYSIISVGKNNRYGHPKDKVLNNLSNSKIYRTDLNGTIAIKINSNYKIKTYSP